MYDYFLIDVIKSRFIFTQHKEKNGDFSVIRDRGFAGYNSTFFLLVLQMKFNTSMMIV